MDHDIPSLGHLLEREGGVSLDSDDFGLIHCDPKVRHGEEVVNPEAASAAHRAVVHDAERPAWDVGIRVSGLE